MARVHLEKVGEGFGITRIELECDALREDVRGQTESAPFEQGGFDAELAAFLDDLRAARFPLPDLRAARQSVAVAMRARADGFG